MCSIPNQPGYLIATAKTCKFSSIDDITLSNLILRPVINLTGRYTCNASNVIPNHLKPLPERLEKQVIKDSYEDISWHVESLFNNMPVSKTVVSILKCICIAKELQPLCKKSILKKLFIKFTK